MLCSQSIYFNMKRSPWVLVNYLETEERSTVRVVVVRKLVVRKVGEVVAGANPEVIDRFPHQFCQPTLTGVAGLDLGEDAIFHAQAELAPEVPIQRVIASHVWVSCSWQTADGLRLHFVSQFFDPLQAAGDIENPFDGSDLGLGIRKHQLAGTQGADIGKQGVLRQGVQPVEGHRAVCQPETVFPESGSCIIDVGIAGLAVPHLSEQREVRVEFEFHVVVGQELDATLATVFAPELLL